MPYFVKTFEYHMNKGQKQRNSESTEVELALQMLYLPLYLGKTFALCQLKFEICQVKPYIILVPTKHVTDMPELQARRENNAKTIR